MVSGLTTGSQDLNKNSPDKQSAVQDVSKNSPVRWFNVVHKSHGRNVNTS